MTPFASMKTVSGTPVTPKFFEISPLASRTLGYGTWYLAMYARAASRPSRIAIPRKRTELPYCFAVLANSGASSRHGSHHDAQKLSTTGFPRNDASETDRDGLPTSGNENAGAGRPTCPVVVRNSVKPATKKTTTTGSRNTRRRTKRG